MKRVTRAVWTVCLTLLGLILYSPHVRAQGAALSMLLDPSIRSAGMGSASTAVFWGGDPNYWANPAVLGYHDGIRYLRGKTQLVPDLADDVYFTSDRWTIAGYGIGVALAGEPFDGLGGLHLSYGESVATDPSGQPIGTFESFEDIRSWGVGVNVAESAENLLRLFRLNVPDVSRWGDVSLGWNWNTVAVSLAPALPGLPGTGEGDALTKDRGYLLRLSPYNSIEQPGYWRGLDSALFGGDVGLRLDVAYGHSEQNYKEAGITFSGTVSEDPILTVDRGGFAAYTELAPSAQGREKLRSSGKRWLADLLTPYLAIGFALDEETLGGEFYDPGSGGTIRNESTVDRWGLEITFANVFTYRLGHVKDVDGSIDGITGGFGLGLSAGRMAGFRYDWASVPQACDPFVGCLATVTRTGWTAFADLVEISKRLRH